MMSIVAGTIAVTASMLPSRRTAQALRLLLLKASSCPHCHRVTPTVCLYWSVSVAPFVLSQRQVGQLVLVRG